jgi:hypothetical protein
VERLGLGLTANLVRRRNEREEGDTKTKYKRKV